MIEKHMHVVTGAFGYSGKYIAYRLIAQGQPIITLTNSPNRDNAFGDQIRAYPFNFDQPDRLVETLRGVEVLYNTYWVRFNHPLFKHAEAVRNTLVLFEAAKKAGVQRIVHFSITNPSEGSTLEYFSGKARLESALIESEVSYAILRPTVIFGKEDILINNIAWALRHLPIFGLFGDGEYRLQPIYVEDLARLAVQLGGERHNTVLNAIGPETFSYRSLVETISRLIGVRRPILSMSPDLAFTLSQVISTVVGDVLITKEEIMGLMADLLYVDTTPIGTTRLTDWVKQNASTLGRHYTSELARRRNRQATYRSN